MGRAKKLLVIFLLILAPAAFAKGNKWQYRRGKKDNIII